MPPAQPAGLAGAQDFTVVRLLSVGMLAVPQKDLLAQERTPGNQAVVAEVVSRGRLAGEISETAS